MPLSSVKCRGHQQIDLLSLGAAAYLMVLYHRLSAMLWRAWVKSRSKPRTDLEMLDILDDQALIAFCTHAQDSLVVPGALSSNQALVDRWVAI